MKTQSFSQQLSDKLARVNIEQWVTDPVYFIETFVKVPHPANGIVPLKLNGYQKQIITRSKNNSIIVNDITIRQIGTSSVLCAFALWTSIVNMHNQVGIHGTTYRQVENNRYLIDVMLDHLPDFVRGIITPRNKRNIGFENGSNIYFFNQNPNNGRGMTFNLSILDTAYYFKPVLREELLEVLSICHYRRTSPAIVHLTNSILTSV